MLFVQRLGKQDVIEPLGKDFVTICKEQYSALGRVFFTDTSTSTCDTFPVKGCGLPTNVTVLPSAISLPSSSTKMKDSSSSSSSCAATFTVPRHNIAAKAISFRFFIFDYFVYVYNV